MSAVGAQAGLYGSWLRPHRKSAGNPTRLCKNSDMFQVQVFEMRTWSDSSGPSRTRSSHTQVIVQPVNLLFTPFLVLNAVYMYCIGVVLYFSSWRANRRRQLVFVSPAGWSGEWPVGLSGPEHRVGMLVYGANPERKTARPHQTGKTRQTEAGLGGYLTQCIY